MQIELKNIKHSPSLSEETEAFTASIYINGVLAGYASNRGNGGPTDYGYDDVKGKMLLRDAEEYCKKLPPIEYPASTVAGAFSVDMDLEQFIDQLLEGHLMEKELQRLRKKMDRAMGMSIVIGMPDNDFGTWNLKSPIEKILVHPKGPDMLKDFLRTKVLPNLKEGEQVLNNNIPLSLYKEAGLAEHQYVRPAPDNDLRRKQKRENKNLKKI